MTTRREAIIHALKDTLRITLIEEFGEILSARITEENMASTADAILAVRLDETAIRKDEREKCAAWHDAQADALEAMIDAIVKDGGWVDRSRKERVEFHRKCAQAIRNGGKPMKLTEAQKVMLQIARDLGGTMRIFPDQWSHGICFRGKRSFGWERKAFRPRINTNRPWTSRPRTVAVAGRKVEMHDLSQTLKAGTLLIVETGEYSDRSWAGPVRLLRDLVKAELADDFKQEWKSSNEWQTKPDPYDFLPWLIESGRAIDADDCHSWHVGSYGEFEP